MQCKEITTKLVGEKELERQPTAYDFKEKHI